MPAHPQAPWIEYAQVGPSAFQCVCRTCSARSGVLSGAGADAFAKAHAHPAPTHYGAGDLVARATGALGIQSCTPCEARKRALNRLLPRVWRR